MGSFLNSSITGSIIVQQYLQLPVKASAPQTGSGSGHIWIDKATGNIKISYLSGSGGAVWESAQAIPSARYWHSTVGTVGSAMSVGGQPTGQWTQTYEYNGITWSAGNSANVGRYGNAGAGSQNDAFQAGGVAAPISVACTETYNGTTWSTANAMNVARAHGGAFGTTSAGAYAGGNTPVDVTCTETYNGTSWSVGNVLSVARSVAQAIGTPSAGLITGGSPATLCTEEYNGTWSTGGALNNFKLHVSMGGSGQNVATSIAGYAAPTNTTCTEEYNGTSWSNSSGYLQGARRAGRASGGGGYSALYVGGFTNTQVACTELYYSSRATAIGRVWRAGISINTGRIQATAKGTSEAAILIGGFTNSVVTCTEEGDGTSWKETAALPSIIRRQGSAGTQNAASSVAGLNASSAETCLYQYDGTAWSSETGLLTAIRDNTAVGFNNDIMNIGGYTNASTTCVEKYNGINWRASAALNVARRNLASAGNVPSALAFAGLGTGTCTEEYNGVSWSASGAMNSSRYILMGGGSQNAGLAATGWTGTPSSCTEEYNGSTWATANATSILRNDSAGWGSQAGAFVTAGAPNQDRAYTEEYSAVLFHYKSCTWQCT